MTVTIPWSQLEVQMNNLVVEAVQKGLEFKYMMPVQKIAIPLILKSHDVAVEAQTGSGKTLSFLLPILHTIAIKHKHAQPNQLIALIIVPTRELAKQIYEVAEKLINYMKNKEHSFNAIIRLIIGGSKVEDDIQNCQKNGANIIVGTPGKLKFLLDQPDFKNFIVFTNFEMLVLDEADRLMDDEYFDDVQFIIQQLPKQRRTELFSATLTTQKLTDLIKFGLRNPVTVSVQQQQQQGKHTYVIPSTLSNEYLIVENRLEKINFVINLITNNLVSKKIIIFLNTCASVEFYFRLFKRLQILKKIKFSAIHGQMKQKKRNKIIEEFRNTTEGILITTDVLARGIDIEDIAQILQIDPPQDPNYFIHRIGRTARTGKIGNALLLLEKTESTFLDFLKLKNVQIKEYMFESSSNEFMDGQKIKDIIMDELKKDRDLIEKGKQAFISFIRSYKEHDLKYIFEFKNLDIGNAANSFFLLRLPRIKEILGKKIENFQQSDIDPEQIQFQDKNQGKQFKEKKIKSQLKREQAEEQLKKSAAQANENYQKINKQTNEIKNNRQARRKIKREHEVNELEDYNAELRLVKKLKSGKITLKQYQEQIKEYDPDDLKDEQYTKDLVLSINGHKKKR